MDTPIPGRLLWTLHGLALLAFAIVDRWGCSRALPPWLAWLITVAYCHRLTGALFGLDQVNAMLAMYFAVGPERGCVLTGPLAEGRAGQGGAHRMPASGRILPSA
jgi:hypothetical protein